VAQPKERIGAMAVDMLLERVGGKRRDARKVVLQPELRVRATTARHASFREATVPAADKASAGTTTATASPPTRKSRTP
jgi:LacI family transcriptional regulator